jgi:hypothetical protein
MRAAFLTFKSGMSHARRHWLTVTFFLGFVVDFLTLNRVDEKLDNTFLALYVILSIVGMLLLYAGIAERFPAKVSAFVRDKSPFLIQYAFGGLLSGMLIFYGRSGAFSASWPFLLAIVAVIYGNETIRNREQRLVYNLSIFFVGLFAYMVLVVPVALKTVGALVFVGSGLIALAVMYIFVRLLGVIIPNFIELHKRIIVFVIGTIYAGFNFLYFLNIIPPIPLSLKEIGIYHSIVRFEDDRYRLTFEAPAWWQFYRDTDDVFHAVPGDNIYCFASVFAPTRLNTEIFHRWEYYDEGSGGWQEHGRFTYRIEGGRDEGYRGYTQIANFREGRWRCTVETERGQALGRISFVVTRAPGGTLVTKVE